MSSVKSCPIRSLNMSVDGGGDGDEQIYGYLPGSIEPYVSQVHIILAAISNTKIPPIFFPMHIFLRDDLCK